jgi:hypothetical protein
MLARSFALAVLTSPFVLWVGTYTYHYIYAVDICRDFIQDARWGGNVDTPKAQPPHARAARPPADRPSAPRPKATRRVRS